ncbi:YggT family protein [Ramlibacter sp. AW1]|uniref:YggT family protein n=1 Tax=Ramlibacter aurantiacus TaxID=2801330 RepID=A0A936ZLS4_9BURK|nr:YggT family protein [Ramlibacter aurantiacus]MBL0423222.1 YggT family protein [Ramlibacter aurantiacus]
MLYEIFSLLLNVAATLFGGACLLRLYMQHQRLSFGNPIGRFVFALTNWLVLPLRRVLPAVGRWDTASAVAAYLIELLQVVLIWAVLGAATASAVLLPLLAVFGLLRLVISSMTVLVIVGAVLSWVRADSPMADLVERLCAPLLRPFRRVIPLVGGIDLSPLALLVLLQVVGIVLNGLQHAVT